MQAEQVLHNVLQHTCPEMHRTRRQALAATVMAALHGQCLTVTSVGRAIRSDAKEKHCIKRADRLLSNPHLHAARVDIYSSIVQWLIGGRKRPVIVVDWSDMDDCKRHFLLRASIPVQGRSMTLYEQTHTVNTKEKPKTHLDFLKTLHQMLPCDCRPIIVSDAGYRTPWFKQVESFGWEWVGRIRNRDLVLLEGEHQWRACKSLYANATATPKALGNVRLTARNAFACQMVLYKGKRKGRVHRNRAGQPTRSAHSRKHAKAQREPWLLATSLTGGRTLAAKVVKLYRLRMQIEEAFRDIKSTRFGLSLEQHLTYQVERLQILLLIAALAVMVAWLIGKAAELSEQHRQYQANTIRSRTVLSSVFLGLRIVDDHRTTLTALHICDAYAALRLIIDLHGNAQA